MSIAVLCCSYFQKYNNLDLIIDDKSYLVALLQGIFWWPSGGITMKNIVKMSDLTNEEVFSLIKRGLELKNGKQVSPREEYQTYFLKIQLEQNIVLK